MNNQFWWESDFFVSFLHWMANEKDGFSDAHEIIYVVEKPWKYKNEWMEFNKEVLEEEPKKVKVPDIHRRGYLIKKGRQNG